MTFLELQDQVMNRLNLTSSDARTRIKVELNLRYAQVQSTVNLDRTRRGQASFTTVSGNSLTTASGIAKVLSVFDPTILMNVLGEVTVNQIRLMDAPQQVTGIPFLYAINNHINNAVTLRLFPQPTAANVLQADVLLAGTNMVEDTDEPSFPTDFHDCLVYGVCADELLKMDKARPLAISMEERYKERVSELRYFVIKSAYLHLTQQDNYLQNGLNARVWPWANLGS